MSTIAKHTTAGPGSELPGRWDRSCVAGGSPRASARARLGAPLTRAFVSAVEAGGTVPSLAALVLMTNRLGVSLETFFRDVNRALTPVYTGLHEHPDTPPDRRGRLGSRPVDRQPDPRASPSRRVEPAAVGGRALHQGLISALETGAAKPSMAALNFIAGRLGTTAAELLANPDTAWTRLDADIRLASGDVLEAIDAYEALIAAGPPPLVRAELLRSLAEASCRVDRPVEAIRVASESVDLFTSLDRPADRAQAAYWLGLAQHLQDNSDEARGLLSAVLAEVRAGLSVAPDFELKVLVALAATETYRGSPQAAIGYLERARSLSAELDDRRRGIVLINLASSYRGAGDHEAAIRYGTQALTLLRAAEADLEAAMLENNLALAYLAVGQHGSCGRAGRGCPGHRPAARR